MCMGDGLLTYWLLGPACGGMMRRTSGWGSLLQLPDGPPTTAPVPCHSGGSVGPGPGIRIGARGGGGGGTIGPRLRHGVLEREVTSVPNLIPNQDSQRATVATAATKMMAKH